MRTHGVVLSVAIAGACGAHIPVGNAGAVSWTSARPG